MRIGFVTLTLLASAACHNPNVDVVCSSSTHGASKEVDESLIGDFAVYKIKMNVGNPPQVIDFVADTGSSDAVALGSSCSGCDASDFEGTFNPSGSTGEGPISLSYGSGSASGILYTEDISLACGKPVSHSLAVIDTSSGLTNSVLGLAYKKLAQTKQDNFIDVMASQMDMSKIFSLTFCAFDGESSIEFGGLDARVSDDSQFVYTNVIQAGTDYDFYRLGSISLSTSAGSLGSIASGQAIVDSGTTLLELPSDLFDAFVAQIKATDGVAAQKIEDSFYNESNNQNYTIDFSADDIKAFPDLLLSIDDGNGPISLKIKPERYLKKLSSSSGRIFAIKKTERIPVFGLPFVENYSIVFDREKNRMGFLDNESLCQTKIPIQ